MADRREDSGREAAIVQAWLHLEEYEAAHPEHPYATVLHLRQSRPKVDTLSLAQEFSEMVGSPISPDAFRKLLFNSRSKFLEVFTGL